MNHLTEEDLILIYYREAGLPGSARAHLADCPACQRAAEDLARSLRLCDEFAVPEPGPEFSRSVWAQIAPQLELRQPKRIFAFWRPPVWAAAGIAVLLIAAFMAGRISRPAAVPAPAVLSSDARERILTASIADHLDRAQMLVTDISHADGGNEKTFSTERDRAEELVREGRLLRQSLTNDGDPATLAFLDDVERFMLETAHTPDRATARDVRALQDRIESGSLLFKLRVTESNLRKEAL